MFKKKINLLYDASSMGNHLLNSTGTGIFTVSLNVLKELTQRTDFKIKLYCNPQKMQMLKRGLEKAPAEIKKLKVFQDTNYDWIDIFVSPMHVIPPEIAQQNKIQKYVIIYDAIPLIFPVYFENNDNSWYWDLFRSLNPHDHYFAISKSAQSDFITYNPNVTMQNSTVIPLACSENFTKNTDRLEKIKSKYHIPQNKKYIFSLCTLEPRKNLIRAVKTFIQFIQKNNINDMVFVLGGGSWSFFVEKLHQEMVDFGNYKDKIILPGYIAKEDLPVLYSGSEWFVYTSEYEGFGLPPLEAMACGCPVIGSNNSSLPEVIGDAGIMIDWDSDEQHIEAYEKYYYNPDLRSNMAQKGFERSKIFSWKQTVDVIENTIKQNMKKNAMVIKNNAHANQKLNLVFDASLLVYGNQQNSTRSGVYFVTRHLLKELSGKPEFEISLYVNESQITQIIPLLAQDEDFHHLPLTSDNDLNQADAFLSPHADIPDKILQQGHIRTYKIVYDFMGCILDDKIFSTRLANHQKGLWCSKLFCISESTKNDYCKFVPQINPDKLIVTHLGANETFYQHPREEIKKIKAKFKIKSKYILSVCNLTPHKNLFTAIDSFIQFINDNHFNDLVYVLCGGIPKHFEKEMEKKLEEIKDYKDKIIFTGYLEDEFLPILYSGAEWFVFPSFYEGFGLPILEAMQCGCPVICSNTSSMPEILGNCGLLVTPENKDEFVSAYKMMYKSNSFRQQCRYRGLERAGLFSWAKMGNIIADEIKQDFVEKADSPDLPIVLITDDNYIKPTIVTITSLLMNKYHNTNYKIYVIGNKLSEESQKLFSAFENVELLHVKNDFSAFEGTHQHVSAAALFKFKIPELFPQYNKILYLDTDMIIQQDLSELFKTDITNHYAAVVKDIECMMQGKHHLRHKLNNYFNSGMMLLNLEKMRAEKATEALINYKKNEKVRFFMDQDAFNVIFNNQVIFVSPGYNYIPVSWNCHKKETIMDFYNLTETEYNYIFNHAPICHFADKNKPWKNYLSNGSEIWAKYYYLSPCKDKPIIYSDTPHWKPAYIWKNFFEQIFTRSCGKFAQEYVICGFKISYYKRFLNKNISFNKLRQNDFKMSGFSHSETWGRWSSGPVSNMHFNLKHIRGDITCKFEVQPFMLHRCLRQKVDIYANNIKVAEWNFKWNEPKPETQFIVSENIRKKDKGKLNLKFIYDLTTSPKDLGIGRDERKIGLGFIKFQMISQPENNSFLQKIRQIIRPSKKGN